MVLNHFTSHGMILQNTGGILATLLGDPWQVYSPHLSLIRVFPTPVVSWTSESSTGISSWCFQPTCTIFVRLDHLPEWISFPWICLRCLEKCFFNGDLPFSICKGPIKNKQNVHRLFETTPIDLVSTVRISSWFKWASFALSEFLFTINFPLLPRSIHQPRELPESMAFQRMDWNQKRGSDGLLGCTKTTEVDGSKVNGSVGGLYP